MNKSKYQRIFIRNNTHDIIFICTKILQNNSSNCLNFEKRSLFSVTHANFPISSWRKESSKHRGAQKLGGKLKKILQTDRFCILALAQRYFPNSSLRIKGQIFIGRLLPGKYTSLERANVFSSSLSNGLQVKVLWSHLLQLQSDKQRVENRS